MTPDMPLPPEIDPTPNIAKVGDLIGHKSDRFFLEMGGMQDKTVTRALLEVRDGVDTSLDTLQKIADALDGKMPIWVDVPPLGSSPGVPGQLAYEVDWLYVCVDTDTWQRVRLLALP